jgi:hypothetical protein
MLQKNNGQRVTTTSRDLQVLSSGSPKNSMVVSMEGEVEAGVYSLLISNFKPKKEADYHLQVMVEDLAASAVLDKDFQ